MANHIAALRWSQMILLLQLRQLRSFSSSHWRSRPRRLWYTRLLVVDSTVATTSWLVSVASGCTNCKYFRTLRLVTSHHRNREEEWMKAVVQDRHWGPVRKRITYRKALPMCKCIHGLALPHKLRSKFNSHKQYAFPERTAFIWHISHITWRDHAFSLLRDRHCLSVKQRVEYKLCMMVDRCLYSDAPSYLLDLITSSANATVRAGLRSAASSTVAVPRTMSSLGDRSFAAAGLRAWNRLPPPLRRVHSAAAFKRQLKTFLFDCAFNGHYIVRRHCCALAVTSP